MINERIKELDATILNTKGNNIHVTSFFSNDSLNYHLRTGNNNIMCFGVYPLAEYNILGIKDNAIFIIKNNDLEIARYCFKVILNGEVSFKKENKSLKRIFKIRKCEYNNIYNYIDLDYNLSFCNIDELKSFLLKTYNFNLNLN